MLIMLSPTSWLTYPQKWRQVLLNSVDGWSVVVSCIVVIQTNSNRGMFSMFNIIKTLRNYSTRDLLHDNLSSVVALHFNVSY